MDVNPLRCCQCVKDRNFESNSQPPLVWSPKKNGCCQCVKDRNFESNSQHGFCFLWYYSVVVSVSKIEISKAIHNIPPFDTIFFGVVVSVSKIEISKAIHNNLPFFLA